MEECIHRAESIQRWKRKVKIEPLESFRVLLELIQPCPLNSKPRYMKLLSHTHLEKSWVVANSLMNRERGLLGSNSYQKELGLHPLEFLTGRMEKHGQVAWLDLCCGSGKALIEAAQFFQSNPLSSHVKIIGIDLVDLFWAAPPDLNCLELRACSLHAVNLEPRFDLITCVQGLHYLGDKLSIIQRATSWLTQDGFFLANLDLENFKLEDGKSCARRIAVEFRKHRFDYFVKKRLLRCEGQKSFTFPCEYLGADDQAGPNYTGQASVNSIYRF